MTTNITSLLYSCLPSYCISPNFFTSDSIEEYPGIVGTGFLAKRNEELFYITARHCLIKDNKVEVSVLPKNLHIPIRLEGNAVSSSDYISFTSELTLTHESNDLPGNTLDFIVLQIEIPEKEEDREHLLSRAIKLPLTGEWLDELLMQPYVQEKISKGERPNCNVIGYPAMGTKSEITYPEKEGGKLHVHNQAAMFCGTLAEGTYPDRLKLTDITWEGDLNGFSGSPVFIFFKGEQAYEYALVGMLVTGGNKTAQFIKISIINQVFK